MFVQNIETKAAREIRPVKIVSGTHGKTLGSGENAFVDE